MEDEVKYYYQPRDLWETFNRRKHALKQEKITKTHHRVTTPFLDIHKKIQRVQSKTVETHAKVSSFNKANLQETKYLESLYKIQELEIISSRAIVENRIAYESVVKPQQKAKSKLKKCQSAPVHTKTALDNHEQEITRRTSAPSVIYKGKNHVMDALELRSYYTTTHLEAKKIHKKCMALGLSLNENAIVRALCQPKSKPNDECRRGYVEGYIRQYLLNLKDLQMVQWYKKHTYISQSLLKQIETEIRESLEQATIETATHEEEIVKKLSRKSSPKTKHKKKSFTMGRLFQFQPGVSLTELDILPDNTLAKTSTASLQKTDSNASTDYENTSRADLPSSKSKKLTFDEIDYDITPPKVSCWWTPKEYVQLKDRWSNKSEQKEPVKINHTLWNPGYLNNGMVKMLSGDEYPKLQWFPTRADANLVAGEADMTPKVQHISLIPKERYRPYLFY